MSVKLSSLPKAWQKKLRKRAPSQLEIRFESACQLLGLHPIREYVFAKPRRWRFDFAWTNEQVAVEIEGGTWIGGRHNRGGGFVKDCDKYNQATLLGWRVLRFTGTHLKDVGECVAMVKELLIVRTK